MSCAACSARVERAVSSLEGVESCSVNLLSNSMSVESSLTDKEIIAAVKKAGYGASVKKEGRISEDNKFETGSRRIMYRLLASVALLLPLMYLSMGFVMFSAPVPRFLKDSPQLIAVIQMVLSGLVLIINNKFFINGFKGIITRAPNMDTLVSMGSGISFLYSIVVIFGVFAAENGEIAMHKLHGLYFESAAMILTLITVGKMLEERAKGKTTSALKALMDLSPKTATVERDGQQIVIPTEEIAKGDIFILKAGSSVPVDGIILDGECNVDEAALTGESEPKDKAVGGEVYAATVVLSGYSRCRASSTSETTKISEVVRLVEEASATKAPISKLADRVSGIFVPVILAVSLITFILWLIISGEVSEAVVHSIAVLVISCPCALGLATPVAIMVGSGVGAKCGILYKTAEAIEHTGRADIILLDKTGTVTEGRPEVVSVIPAKGISEEKLLSVAYALEVKSEHPQARAIVRFFGGRIPKYEVKSFKNHAGSGVSGELLQTNVYEEEKQTIIYGGNYRFVSSAAEVDAELRSEGERLSEEGKTPLFFSENGRAIGIIATADKIRDDSKEAVARLRRMGLRVVMLTGDNRRVAQSVGKELGIGEVISDVLPDGKADEVARLKKEGRVIMVGDGINDAPALTLADVGMAIGGGTDIAVESADVVLVGNSISDAVAAVRLGRRVLKNIRENLFFAFIYNSLGIPMAAGLFGFTLPPMFGALAMSLSSFSVVSNALRINNFKK